MTTRILWLVGLVICSFTLACSVNSTNGANDRSANGYDTSTAETLGEAIAGIASSTDNSGSVVSYNGASKQTLPLAQKLKHLMAESLESKAFASACLTSATVAGSSCGGANGDVMSISLNSCTGFFGTWSGSTTLTFTDNTTCSDAAAGGLFSMPANTSVTLTSPGGVTLTTLLGYQVVTDSNSSGYSTSVSGGTQLTCNSGGCALSRTANVLGIHRKLVSPLATLLFDHSFNTPTPLTITGTGASKQITAGTIQLQHNLAHYTATAQIVQPLTFSAHCCVPTGGSVLASYTSGSKSGSETITFGPTCGVGSVNGNTFSLTYCQ